MTKPEPLEVRARRQVREAEELLRESAERSAQRQATVESAIARMQRALDNLRRAGVVK